MNCRKFVLLFLLLLMPLVGMAEKTDIVILKNGDKITGEVKRVGGGLLEFKTDTMDTVYIEWRFIAQVISQTTQPSVATMLKGAQSLGMAASTYGEAGKITFLGCHYAGGPDLIALAGSAAENYYWTTSYKLMTAKGPGTDARVR